MYYLGDYFALGLIILLCMFYFDGGYFATKSNRYFARCLIMAGTTTLLDILACILLKTDAVPLGLNMTVNSLFFAANVLTSSSFALFLCSKILEHVYNRRAINRVRFVLSVLIAFYGFIVICNIETGWLFYFDDYGNYQRGDLNALGYLLSVLQMGIVIICYFRHRSNSGRVMKRALLQTFPVVIICFILQRFYPQIMLNGVIMAMSATVMFLNFQSQRQGVHTLTNLNDRHRFFDDVSQRIAHNQKIQVLLINFLHFGEINQRYGHAAGDEILYQFALTLENLVPDSTPFHMNGTVFALVVPYYSEERGKRNARILCGYLHRGISYGQHRIAVDATVVEYLCDDPGLTMTELYERLEYAISVARQKKLTFLSYNTDLGRQMRRNQYLTERMKTIDRAHGFQVWFQPVYSLSEHKFCSMEALIRLQEPDGSLVSPNEFIPLAEKNGMIDAITWFVLKETCRFLAEHPELDLQGISVNLPMAQLLTADFSRRVSHVVDNYEIEHSKIKFEFTERAILDDFKKTEEIMTALTQDGFQFYLDDFGTGYSNFNCLLQLPFYCIKLDMSLCKDIENQNANHGLVRTLSTLFHSMGLTIIAEGAESKGQVDALYQQGIDRIQGYYFAKPMSEHELLEFWPEDQILQISEV